MSIVLEPVIGQVEEEVEPPETAAPESVVEAAPEAVEQAAAPEPVEQAAEPTTPAPKKRGRPRKDITPAKAAPKARAKAVPKRAATAPAPAPPPSSDEEEPMSQADLETEILHYLVQRRSQQQDRRRQLWSQLAGLG